MNFIENKMLSMVNIKDIETIVKAKMRLKRDAQINVKQYLEEWASNKAHIFELFGGKLTLEEEVELDLTQNLKVIKCSRKAFLAECVSTYEENLFKLLLFFEELSPIEFANNIINIDREILGVKISKGNKISRTISKFVSDKKIASDITTKYSMIVQEFKAKGKVVLSIDPIDYFTMSENDSNWTSCHSLTGCYQTGTVAYLQDSTTVIAYAKPIRNTTVNFHGEVASYSNKVWRQVVMFSDNFVYATQSRQYPADMIANRTTVGNMLIKLLEGYNNTEYVSHDWEVSDNWAAIECHECAGNDVDWYCYNDITHEAFNTAYSLIPSTYDNVYDFFKEMREKSEYCSPSSSVACLCCGQHFLENAESLICEDCE